jgi:hypothetical protein
MGTRGFFSIDKTVHFVSKIGLKDINSNFAFRYRSGMMQLW